MIINLPEDFELDWTLRFLSARAIPGLESLEGGCYSRALTIGDASTVVLVRFPDATVPVNQRALIVNAPPATDAPRLRQIVRRMFDLDAPLDEFQELARRDPLLAPLVRRRPGLRVPQIADPFEALVRAIVGQQVSVAGARTMVGRIVERFGNARSFPAADALAEAEAGLLALGFTRAKAAALQHAARAVREGTLDWRRLRRAPAEAQTALEALRGVGPWTASYVRMRALGDRDAFPAADLGVIKALARQNGGTALSARAVEARAEAWKPWRAYATLHLWASLE